MSRRVFVCALAVLLALVSIHTVEAKTNKSKKSRPTTKAPKENPPPADEAAELRPCETVELPAPLTRVVMGGSGKYLAAVVPERKKVIVVDVAAGQIVKQIAVDDDDVQIAAGETRLVVLQCGKRALASYKLISGEREQTLACQEYRAVAMGSSTEGPLLALGDQIEVIDLKTLKPTGVATKLPQVRSNRNLVASAAGTTFCSWGDNSSPSGVAIFDLTSGALESSYAHKSAGHVLPAADGRVIYTGLGPYGIDAKPVDKHTSSRPTNVYIPAATGPFYLMFSQPSAARSREKQPWRLTLHCQNDPAPLLTLSDVHLPSIAPDLRSTAISTLSLEERIFLLPAIDALVTVSEGADQFLIQHFNIGEELERQARDYLFVASTPPREFVRGQTIKYQIELFCKRAPAVFTLELGPPGMKVSPEGLLTWEVPNKYDEHEVAATVNIRDAAGQEIVHTVRLDDVQPKKTELARSQPGHQPTDSNDPSASQARPSMRPSDRRSPKPPSERRSTGPQPLPGTVTPEQAAAMANPRSNRPEAGPLTGSPQEGWQWSGPFPVFVRNPHGMLVGVISGMKLFAISADGTPSTDPATLPGRYAFAGMRGDRVIGVRAAGSQFDVVDSSGNLVRQVKLNSNQPSGLALHPHKPICYVALDRKVGILQGEFVVVNEETGVANAGEEQIGQTIEIDPSGRFLVASYFQAIHVGDRLVVSAGRAGPRAPAPPHPSPGRPAPGRNRPGAAPPQSGLQLRVRHEFADVAMAFIYDLENPLVPTMYGGRSLKQMRALGLRISYDGHQFATVQENRGQLKLVGCDLMDRKAALIRYDGADDAANSSQYFDLGFHPLLPIAVIALNGTLRFCDLHGKPLAGKEPIAIATAPDRHVDRVLFSADGQHLVVVSSNMDGTNHFISQVSVPLTAEELAAAHERSSAPPPKFEQRLEPLSELTALAGGLPKPHSAAEITAEYADAVVIVQGADSTGTGFVVGSSGLILTAAHCVSPLENIEVVYHPAGRPDERKTAEATILRRDKKADLALLRIDVDEPLHAVLLADPLDVKGGEEVTIIANPALGNEVLENTVTTGIVSNAKRKIENNFYIQSSAAVNPGSSGGPMFDRNGRVIGVVVLKAGIEGAGFAVPIVDVCRFLSRLTQVDGAAGQLQRKWVDSSGKHEIHARLMGFDASSVTLAAPGDTRGKKRPLAELSVGDQKLLELLRTAK